MNGIILEHQQERPSSVHYNYGRSVAAVQVKSSQADDLDSACTAKLTPVWLAVSEVDGPCCPPITIFIFSRHQPSPGAREIPQARHRHNVI